MITFPPEIVTLDEFEHCASVPESEMFMYSRLSGPDWLIIIWQKLRSALSVMFALMLIMSYSYISAKDLFSVVFTVGIV